METSQGPKIILPTLQSNFNYAVNEILRRMNTMDMFSVWRAIQTLYRILPPKIHAEVKSDYEEIVRRVNDANNGVGVDFLDMVEANNKTNMILEELAIPFFRKCYEMLYEGGYLEKVRRFKKGQFEG